MMFVNRICPNCKNSNYMVLLGDFSTAYQYKCMNCNGYFNDIDFGEPLRPVWLKERMNKKVDMVEVVRCKDCKYWVPGVITDRDDFIPPKCGKYSQMVGHSADDFCSLAEQEVTGDEQD